MSRTSTRLKALENRRTGTAYCVYSTWTKLSAPAEDILVKAWTGEGEMVEMTRAEFERQFPDGLIIMLQYAETNEEFLKNVDVNEGML